MLLARQNFALCVLRSYSSQRLLAISNHKPLPFRALALYSYSTQSKAITHEHQTQPPAQLSLTLNPPISTLPPPLLLPTSEPNLPATEKLKFYYRTGKAYLTFYKTGVKALWQNYKLLRQLRLRIPSGQSAAEALRAGLLSRGEYHLIRRTKSDMSRVPIFILVLAICGEFTPIVVLFLGLSGAVPRICHVPRQIDGAREKAEARRRESFREGTISSAEETEKVEDMQQLPRPIMLHVARSLGLYSPLWDKVGATPTILLPRRIHKAVERIDVDDFAIERGGGVKHLSEEELKLAAEERGLDVVGRPTDELGSVLGRWIDARKRASTIDLLCKRPSAWPRA
ncbi:MAG: hypothetical protein L6R38_000117 [Xanthoria sp. 2 TBL-2021]|nr:MAG: hypothetical protein L6R38_000117 [Xanthoria sp. 2 TBL-2021]